MGRDRLDRPPVESELREREEQYREQEAKWRRIFESSSDGLIINDPARGVVVEANPAVCQMHGYTYEEFIGLHATAFIHPDYHQVFADFRETIMAGGTYQTQAIDLRKDGSLFHVEVHGSSMIYQGRPHILAIVRDITQRIEAEQAVLDERQRLSRELHDSVSQALYSIALSARTARVLLDRDPALAVEPLEFTLAQAERGLAEMRALIFELRPESLEQEGLVGVLQKHADAVKIRHHIRVETSLGEEPDVPLTVKEALYRIAQEALHNAVKHAGARTIRLSLAPVGERVTLGIEDDGKGFDPSSSFPGHIGLQSMRERATRLGGTLQIESAVGVGTRILAAVPFHEL
ncbi:MAG: PAS domain S-box protein [Chloroflexi bacterium]|nr:PAS domain S-box protein [Chloroflexota bacterium]